MADKPASTTESKSTAEAGRRRSRERPQRHSDPLRFVPTPPGWDEPGQSWAPDRRDRDAGVLRSGALFAEAEDKSQPLADDIVLGEQELIAATEAEAAAAIAREKARELARELAQQAKARIEAAREQQERMEAQAAKVRAAADKSATAKAKKTSTAPPAVPASVPRKRSSLSQRARRPMSAKEALEQASEKEEAARPHSQETRIDPEVESAINALVRAQFPTAKIVATATIRDRLGFESAWRHHHEEALTNGDVRLAVAATLLLNAVSRLAVGELEVAIIEIEGRRWGIWADGPRGLLLSAGNPDYLPLF